MPSKTQVSFRACEKLRDCYVSSIQRGEVCRCQPAAETADSLVYGALITFDRPLALASKDFTYGPRPTHACSMYILLGRTSLFLPFSSAYSTAASAPTTVSLPSSRSTTSTLPVPSPMPFATAAWSRAYSRKRRTSRAAFLPLKRICTSASSTPLPAICRASGISFLTLVSRKCDLAACSRSVRASCVARVMRPRVRTARIVILRCQRRAATGFGSSAAAMLAGLRGGAADGVLGPSVGWADEGAGEADGSSKIEGARSPWAGGGRDLAVGFFLRRSAVAGSRGGRRLKKLEPHIVRLWEGTERRGRKGR